jgi:hypothetical protein
MKSQFEFRKIGQSYWFHHLWFPEHNGQFLEEADSDSFETYNANDGILRTLTSASHLSADEKYGYIMNKAAPACEKSVFPEIFNLSCRCDSWTSMKHIIENSSSWKFVISNKPNLIAIEMDDYHCEFPKTKSSGKRTIWLDPEKGFVLVYENRDMTVLGNQWWSRKIVEDFLLVDGIWIPSKVINYRHFPNSFLEGSGVELTLDDVSIGKVEQSHLSVEFPNGITVFDQIRGIEYIEGDYVPDTPTQDASIFRYSMIFLGCVLLIFGLWRMYYEMKNSSK